MSAPKLTAADKLAIWQMRNDKGLSPKKISDTLNLPRRAVERYVYQGMNPDVGAEPIQPEPDYLIGSLADFFRREARAHGSILQAMNHHLYAGEAA